MLIRNRERDFQEMPSLASEPGAHFLLGVREKVQSKDDQKDMQVIFFLAILLSPSHYFSASLPPLSSFLQKLLSSSLSFSCQLEPVVSIYDHFYFIFLSATANLSVSQAFTAQSHLSSYRLPIINLKGQID